MAHAEARDQDAPKFKLGAILPTKVENIDGHQLATFANGWLKLTPRLGAHVDRACMAASPPPSSTDRRTKAAASLKRMYLNDRYGDCVFAGKYHLMGLWSGNDADAGGEVQATDKEVQKEYFDYTGGRDQGAIITEVLDIMVHRGLTAAGQARKADGYAAVDPADQLLVKTAIALFGGLTLGLDLPADWANNGQDGSVWDVTRSRSVGGHDVSVVDYDSSYVYVSTWGGIVKMTWRALADRSVVTECYVTLGQLWYGADKVAPCGVNLETLMADVKAIQGGDTPPIPDPTPPPAPPPPPPPPPPIPPPVPPLSWWQKVIAWLESLILHAPKGQALMAGPDQHDALAADYRLTAVATLGSVDWSGIIAWIKATLAKFGPQAVPFITDWISKLTVSPIIKSVLLALLGLLIQQMPQQLPEPPDALPGDGCE